MQNAARQPNWWSDTHDSAWDRMKEALKRDWEQTKNDLTGGGRDLNQDAGDTFRQAQGKAPVPPSDVPNPPDANDLRADAKKAEKAAKNEMRQWERSQDAVQYGFGAGLDRSRDWSSAETDLRNEWGGLERDRAWDDVRDDVRHGWEGSRKADYRG